MNSSHASVCTALLLGVHLFAVINAYDVIVGSLHVYIVCKMNSSDDRVLALGPEGRVLNQSGIFSYV